MTLLDGVPFGTVLEAVGDLCGVVVEQCHECNKYLFDGYGGTWSDVLEARLCDSCYGVCDWCDEVVAADSLDSRRHIDGVDHDLCSGCYHSLRSCESCGGFLDLDSDEWSRVDGDIWCSGCCERHLHSCENCGEWTDDSIWCGDCDHCSDCGCQCPEEQGSIHDYSYKPCPDFYGVGPLFIGLELEVETGNSRESRESLAASVTDRFGGLVYCKNDSSLNDGFEIVTHPMSPDYFRGLDTFDRVVSSLASDGCTSWQGHTCGFHVHMTRAAFHSHKHLFAFALFFYRNRDQIRAISGRRGAELDRYASLTMHSGTRVPYEHEPRLIDKVRGHNSGARMAAVNLQNWNTVEVRLFRGSLKVETLRGAVELCLALFDFTAGMSSRALRDGGLEWARFRDWLDVEQFPNLVSLCDRRGV